MTWAPIPSLFFRFGARRSRSCRRAFPGGALSRLARKYCLLCVYGRILRPRASTGFRAFPVRKASGAILRFLAGSLLFFAKGCLEREGRRQSTRADIKKTVGYRGVSSPSRALSDHLRGKGERRGLSSLGKGMCETSDLSSKRWDTDRSSPSPELSDHLRGKSERRVLSAFGKSTCETIQNSAADLLIGYLHVMILHIQGY